MYSWRLTRKDGVCCIHGLSLFSDSPQIAKMGTHPHSFGGSVQTGRRNYFGFNLVLGYSIKFHLIYDFFFVCLFAFSTLAVSIVSFICFFWYLIIVKKYRGACTWVMHASACMHMGYACKCMHAHGLCMQVHACTWVMRSQIQIKKSARGILPFITKLLRS